MPSGVNIMAININNGITDFGVNIGCQAFNRCCLNAVLGGFLDLWIELVGSLFKMSSSSSSSEDLLLRKKFMMVEVTFLMIVKWWAVPNCQRKYTEKKKKT